MSVEQIREALKYMSGDELAEVQNNMLTAEDTPDDVRAAGLSLVSDEIRIRSTEGLGRKAERFWNRHGERIGMIGLGALLGIELSD